jgi:hypothetical protein
MEPQGFRRRVSNELKAEFERQSRWREASLKCLGVIASGSVHGSENVREAVRLRLRRQYALKRSLD